LWRRLLVERTYTVDDFSSTIPALIDFGGCRTGPIKIGRFMYKPTNRSLEVVKKDGTFNILLAGQSVWTGELEHWLRVELCVRFGICADECNSIIYEMNREGRARRTIS
jgi:hypothetical protein